MPLHAQSSLSAWKQYVFNMTKTFQRPQACVIPTNKNHSFVVFISLQPSMVNILDSFFSISSTAFWLGAKV